MQLRRTLEWTPDVFHSNDWHTALVPFYLRETQQETADFKKCGTVLTIHNAAYQGNAPATFRNSLGISPENFVEELLEDLGQLNLLIGGIHFADQVNTVRPGDAEELNTPLGSHGLHEVYRRIAQDFSGILNGCEYDNWNPESASHLPARFSVDDLTGKKQCKKELQKIFDLPE